MENIHSFMWSVCEFFGSLLIYLFIFLFFLLFFFFLLFDPTSGLSSTRAEDDRSMDSLFLCSMRDSFFAP